MTGDLRATLERLARPGAEPNAAFDRLVADYAAFHLVLSVLALVLAVAAGVGVVAAWRCRRSATAATGRRWTFERATWSMAILAGVGVCLAALLLVAANLSNALDPVPGLRGSIPLVADHAPGSDRERTDVAFDRWLRSGERRLSPEVRSAVDRRLAWQRPKAIVCTLLLIVVLLAGRWLWRSVLARARRPDHRWGMASLARLAGALAAIVIGSLLVLMVMGNVQASSAPVSMTLFFG